MLLSLMRSVLNLLNAPFPAGRLGFARSAAVAMVALCASNALAAPEIAVVQRRTTVFDGGTFNFGEVRQDRSLILTFTVSNEGDTDLTISNVTVAAPFQIAAFPTPVVRPGKRTTVRVNIPAGLAPGVITGELSIENDDPNEGPFGVTLNATIIPVVPDAVISVGNLDVLSGGAFDMGVTEAGIPIARKFTLRNTGNADLLVSAPTVAGSGFSVEFPKGRTIRPGKKINFNVRFVSSTAGDFDGVLTLSSNDPDESPYEVDLLAGNTPADARVRAFSQGTPLENGDAVDFGNTTSNKPVTRTLTLRNDGRATLTISAFNLTGEGFTLLSSPRTSLARGKSTKFKVRLDPEMTGPTPMGSITFNTNDPNNAMFVIDLGADVTSVSPLIAVTGPGGSVTNGATVALEPTNVNQGLQATFTVSNPGTADLTLGTVTVTGTGYSLVDPPDTTIAPGRTTTFAVRLFSAALLDPANGTVSFTTNVTGSSPFSFSLNSAVRVIPPSPEVEVVETIVGPTGNPTMVNVPVGSTRNYSPPPLAAGSSLIRTYTIRNRGTSDLTLSALALTNTEPMGSTAFSVLSGAPLPAMLAPAATTTFTIQFMPLAPGNFRAGVSFVNNDPDDGEAPFTFTVTGQGTAADISFTVDFAESSRVRMKKLNFPLDPIATRPYPFSLGAGPAGGVVVTHNTPLDSFFITNRGETPQIFSNASIIDPVDGLAVWFGDLSPPPCFPVACPTPMDGVVRLNISHTGVQAGPSRGLVSIDVSATAPAFHPWEFEIQEWVDNWFPTMGGLNGGFVRSFTTYDPDGSGTAFSPQLYAGGSFGTPAGSPRIARAVGGNWEALLGGGVNTGGASQINALTVYDPDGSGGPIPSELYAGGMSFSSIGTPAVTGINNMAKYNGATNVWSPVGTGAQNGVTGGAVHAMAVFAPTALPTDPASQLYVGGNFTAVPGNTVQGIARWDGTQWRKLLAMNDGISGGAINALAVYDPDGNGPTAPELYAGGSFVNLTSVAGPVNGIARFNGALWSAVGTAVAPDVPGVSGLSARVNALVVYDADGPEGVGVPVLVAGGSFLNVPNVAGANSVAAWNGTGWQRLGTSGIGDAMNGPGGEVFALAVYDEDAFHPDDNDGETSPNPGGTTLRYRTQPERLYAAGNFSFMTQGGNSVFNIARWNPASSTWGPVGTDIENGTNGEVRALHAFDADGLLTAGAPNNPARLFVGGFFTQAFQLNPAPPANTLNVNNVAVWGWAAP